MAPKEIEDLAIKWVIDYETKHGRNPRPGKGSGYDVLSDGFKIEVKGRSKEKRPHVLLNSYNIKALLKAGDDEYRLYIVMSPERNPKLLIYKKNEVLSKIIERKQWKFPLRKADFQRGISLS